ncbi:MAG: hypothetical protein IPH24_08755 [Crocinitomicaceae bacterium]|nr:hypothetical protein [Crocinitomicaceae bacterium]
MKNIVVLILAILCGVVVSAQVNIVSALELHKSIYGSHNYSDLTANSDFTDLKNGYYESRFVTDPANSDWDILLTQARLYLNKDRTYLLAVTYFDSDEQCSRYKTSFYEVSKMEIHFFSYKMRISCHNLPGMIFYPDPNQKMFLKNIYLKSNKSIWVKTQR